jgi:hypothetical protein
MISKLKNMKIIVMVLALLFGASVYSQNVNDPNVQLREAKDFNAIRISSAFDVYLTQDKEEKVAVSASESKYLENITVEVKNGVLEIGWTHAKGKWNLGNKKLKAYISFKSLTRLTADGACDVRIVGAWKADDLEIRLAGASDLDGQINAKQLSLSISGASDITITGSAIQLSVDVSGSSSLKGYDFSADVCNAVASGASDIRITVNKELSADASGSSDIDYRGPAIMRDMKTSGAGSISHKS